MIDEILPKPEIQELLQRMAQRVRRASPRCGHDEDDIRQQFNMAVLREMHRFDDSRGTPEAFIVMVSKSEAASMARSWRRQKRDARRSVALTEAALEQPEPAESPTGRGDVVLDGEARGRMNAAIARLSPRDREVCGLLARVNGGDAVRSGNITRGELFRARQRAQLALTEILDDEQSRALRAAG